ncbi:hypothetical protein [Mycobacterium numidiamassiliense]|uniref:hypothetical protein n=1 Tax=Mycobacterium numidiamassiliense TaxID=1841861 RepID=UPI0013F5D28F|nr:hypothetical protein [Mycobacterium numidiamassiliense]
MRVGLRIADDAVAVEDERAGCTTIAAPSSMVLSTVPRGDPGTAFVDATDRG